MHRKILLISFLTLFFLIGCQKNPLTKSAEKFSANGSEYSIQLPSKWEKDKEETAINKSAVLSAKDTKSNSGMYILTDKTNKMSEKELEKYAKNYLKDYYTIKGVKFNKFEVDGNPAINCTFPTKYEKKEALLDVYYVSMEKSVVRLFFFSPTDNSYDKRKQTFDDSLKTLKEKVTNEVTEESSDELDNRIQNKDFSLQISTYELKQLEDKKLLAIRYLCTNKEQVALEPIDKWDSFVKVYQGETELIREENKKISDDTLDFLTQNNFREIEKDEAIESAVVYQIDEKNEEKVQIRFEGNEFKNKEPLTLTLKN